jgi:hypothetical protein
VKHRSLQILWPAFLVAGVIEILLFAAFDPLEIRWFGGLVGWKPVAIYSVVFLVLWMLVASAGALTILLRLTGEEVDPPKGSPPRF